MRKQLVVAGVMTLSAIAFGQKKELKKAEKAIKSGDISEAMSYVNQAEGLISGADTETMAQFYVVKGETYLAEAGESDFTKLKTAAEAFIKSSELNSEKYAERTSLGIQNLRTALVNSAVRDQNSKNYAMAAEKLETSYSISRTDTLDLYFAAGNAINAKNYAAATSYYETLLELGFTGIRTEYIVNDIETDEIVAFNTESERNTSMLSGQYNNPKTRLTESLRADILTNLALLLVAEGKNDKAMEIIQKARSENPKDASLIRAEADMAYKTGDMAKYNALMQEVIEGDPNNPELYYNLGVGSSQIGETDKALGYYKKAIELRPDYANAQINIAALMLAGEAEMVEEMNNLGTSSADNKRYDELKDKRKQLYLEVLPYLESALSSKGDNVELIRTIMNLYSQLGMDDKFKMMKSKLQTLEGGQ